MAISYGFFNSLNGDRVYNADTIGDMFEGLIRGGVYESVGNAFIVQPSSGLTLSIGSGRAIVGDKWVKNDADITITLNNPHVTLNRYTAIVLRKSATNRNVTLQMIDGTPATTPTKPDITRDASTYDICLAYVYVSAGATAITASNIEDTRTNTNLCGFVTGLITQVNTTELFNQYKAAADENLEEMEDWEATQKASFQAWLADLTQELNVDTFIQPYYQHSKISTMTLTINITGYTYEAGDIINVFINGLRAIEGVDYSINTSGASPIITFNFTIQPNNEAIDIQILKSVIGFSTN